MIEQIYTNYNSYLESIKDEDIKTSNFKSNPNYTPILEHVSYDLGNRYLSLILDNFEISDEDIQTYVSKNDSLGNPFKYNYSLHNKNLFCSPTSLRYVLQSLLILEQYKISNCTKIVEIGGGYGGLLLAIDFFSKQFDVTIDHYYIIDMDAVNNIINKYVNYHQINTPFSTHNAFQYGSDVNDTDLFLISNYCFTEIDESHRINYKSNLLPKVSHGFITWQTYLINLDYDIKFNKHFTEEYPQTSSGHKNYYVWF
jgi:hypothetical protein